MNDKLLPCPFCGGKARWRYQKPIGWVMCKECGASSATLSDKYEEADCRQEAISAWNRRADVAPVVHGEWTTNSDYPDTIICSLCGWRESVWWADKGTNYCPNCGAKMDKESDNNA